MNLLLFEAHEQSAPLLRSDPRARHLEQVLKRTVGDLFDAGIVDGARGKGRVTALQADHLDWSFEPLEPVRPREPITLIVGLPRPQTARKILQETAALGVGALHFVRTEKAESSYAESQLWTSGEWRRHLIAGTEQAFATRLPEVSHGRPLAEALAALAGRSTRLALDNYEAAYSLADYPVSLADETVLALGAERGWSATERHALRAAGFVLVHLGSRVLRTETACVAGLTLVRARRGLLGGEIDRESR